MQKVPSPSSGLGVLEVFGDLYFTIRIDAIAVCPDGNPNFPSREGVAAMDDKDLLAALFNSQGVRSVPLVFTDGVSHRVIHGFVTRLIQGAQIFFWCVVMPKQSIN